MFTIMISTVIILANTSDAKSEVGVCDSAAEMGVCLGTGAKCNVKVGMLTFRCGKDPNGPSIKVE
jgi:hypothetical protein